MTAAESLAQAAADVFEVQWRLARAGRGLAQAALAGAAHFTEWTHYPRRDHLDARSGVRFYYHAHAAAQRLPGEHGHFHVFVPSPGAGDAFSHLAGLSLDAQGRALRLFTVNRWVTGERWCEAATLGRCLDGLRLQARGRLAPVARWLQGMLCLYAGTLVELLHERDRRLAEAAGRPGAALSPDDPVLEDQRLHIVSQRPLDLFERLGQLTAEA